MTATFELDTAEAAIINNRRNKQRVGKILNVAGGFYDYSLTGRRSLNYSTFLEYIATLSPSELPPNIEDDKLFSRVSNLIHIAVTDAEAF